MAAIIYRNDVENTVRAIPVTPEELAIRRRQHEEAVEHNSNADIPIFRLSPELRNRIYELVLPRNDGQTNSVRYHLIRSCGRPDAGAASNLEPALLRTCTLFCREASQMYYASIIYDFHTHIPVHPPNPVISLRRWLQFMGVRLKFSPRVQIWYPMMPYQHTCWNDECMDHNGNVVIVVLGTQYRVGVTACPCRARISESCKRQIRREVEDAVQAPLTEVLAEMPWVEDARESIKITIVEDAVKFSTGYMIVD